MQAKLNGIQVSYEVNGPKQAPWVTLVHGFPFSRALWKGQVAALKKDYRVLTYDLRGMGQTSLGKTPQLLEAYVDDLLALLKHLKIERSALGGLSMGGYVALRAYQKAPERFWALGLFDTRADADPDPVKLGRAAGIATVRGKGVKAFVEGMLPRLLAEASFKAKPKVAAGLKAMMLRSKPDGVCNALAAMAGRTDSRSALPDIKVPTLCMVGSLDAVTPPALAEAMQAAIPGAVLAEIPGAGHVSNLEEPVRFNQALGAFLGQARVRA
jgi:3-oxoadipate enol-lactonase